MDAVKEELQGIADSTEDQQGSTLPSTLFNKYGYDEFLGFDGKRLLDRILQVILTQANWRTWHFADDFVAPGNDCYVGTYRLAQQIRPGVRKVEMDFKSLRTLGLVEIYPDYRLVKSATGKFEKQAVMVKDFSKLYALAHEFYVWENSSEYIPPERWYKDLILADEALTQRLRRFDCYRRILECATPGRKSAQHTPMSHTEMVALAAKDAEECSSSIETKEFNNTSDKTSSPYRIPELSNNNNIDTSSYSTPERRSLAVAAIRNRDTQSEDTSSKLNSPIPPQEERRGAERAEEVLGYTENELRQDTAKRGAAAIGVPADQHRKLNGGLDRDEERERHQREREVVEAEVPARPVHQVPTEVIEEILQFARQYDDPHLLPSVRTRARKTYAVAEEALDYFNLNFFWRCFDAAKIAAVNYASEIRNSKGRRTCVPYFFTCLENEFGFSLEEMIYLREDDPLYDDYSLFDVVNDLRYSYNKAVDEQQTDLDHRTWLISILDQKEHRTKPKKRLNPTTREYRL